MDFLQLITCISKKMLEFKKMKKNLLRWNKKTMKMIINQLSVMMIPSKVWERIKTAKATITPIKERSNYLLWNTLKATLK